MKTESLEILKSIYFSIQQNDKQSELLSLIEDIVRIENTARLSKFNFYNYVVKKSDPNFERMGGIYFNEGYQIASDLQILIAEKCDYPVENENKAIQKDGKIVTFGEYLRYPDWKAIFPTQQSFEFELDFDRIAELEKQIAIKDKLDRKHLKFINIQGRNFRADCFIKFAKFLKHRGLDKARITLPEGRSSYLFVNNENEKAVIVDNRFIADKYECIKF